MAEKVSGVTLEDITQELIALLGAHKKADFSNWTAETTLAEIGVDSLDLIEFLFLVEDKYEIDIDYNANLSYKEMTTIGVLAKRAKEFINNKTSG